VLASTKDEAMQKCKFILGIDLEGVHENLIDNGINLKTDRVTEVGAVLWDCERSQPVQFLSELINEPDHLAHTDELTELTGIDDVMLESWGNDRHTIPLVLSKLADLIDKASFLMAHNAHQYDRPMLEALFRRFGKTLPEKTWICSMEDIEYPSKITTKSMAGLEHAHGFINPFPHRAVTDVLSMLKIASHYDYDRMAMLAQSPRVTIVAKLEAPNWRNREEVEQFNRIKNKVAKARFRWDAQDKVWTKRVHKLLLDEGRIQYDFETVIEL
jgi:DNA polymerase III subunit epsilon